MLSNLPVAEAQKARIPTPASQAPEAKGGTTGQSFFDMFTNDPGSQNNAKGGQSAESEPTGIEPPETSETEIPHSGSAVSTTTRSALETSTFQESFPSNRNTSQVFAASEPAADTDAFQDQSTELTALTSAHQGARNNTPASYLLSSAAASEPNNTSPAGSAKSKAATQRLDSDLLGLTPFSEQVIRTQQVSSEVANGQRHTQPNLPQMSTNQANPKFAAGNGMTAQSNVLPNQNPKDSLVFPSSLSGQAHPANSHTTHIGSAPVEPTALQNGSNHPSQRVHSAPESGAFERQSPSGKADLPSEKVALSAQEQVFLNANRSNGDVRHDAGSANTTRQPIQAKEIDQHVSSQVSSRASESRKSTRLAASTAIPSDAIPQETRVKASPIGSEPFANAQKPGASLVQVSGQPTVRSNSAIAFSDVSTIPAISASVSPAQAAPSGNGKQILSGGSQIPSPQTLNATHIPTGTRLNAAVAKTHARATEGSETGEAAGPDRVAAKTMVETTASGHTGNTTVSVSNTAPSIAGRQSIPSISQGLQTSTLLHDPDLSMDESSAEISRISDQVSLGLSGPESATTPATRPEAIRSIAAQMVTAAPRGTQPPVEIALNPEELGQVKMSVTTTDTSVVMTIAAERPETLDLMRRNLEQLTNEFRDLGYSDISFVFAGDDSDASGNSDGSHGNQNGSSPEQEQVALNETKTPSATSSGVDVRL